MAAVASTSDVSDALRAHHRIHRAVAIKRSAPMTRGFGYPRRVTVEIARIRTCIVQAPHAPRSCTAYAARITYVMIHHKFAAFPESMSWRNKESMAWCMFAAAPRTMIGKRMTVDAAAPLAA